MFLGQVAKKLFIFEKKAMVAFFEKLCRIISDLFAFVSTSEIHDIYRQIFVNTEICIIKRGRGKK